LAACFAIYRAVMPGVVRIRDGERPVLCRVSHEALQDLANRVHFDGTDEKIFEVYRELIERVASDAYDAGTSVDDAGLVLVTAEASPEWAAAREEAALNSSSSLPYSPPADRHS
jgi:hypothetical protein